MLTSFHRAIQDVIGDELATFRGRSRAAIFVLVITVRCRGLAAEVGIVVGDAGADSKGRL